MNGVGDLGPDWTAFLHSSIYLLHSCRMKKRRKSVSLTLVRKYVLPKKAADNNIVWEYFCILQGLLSDYNLRADLKFDQKAERILFSWEAPRDTLFLSKWEMVEPKPQQDPCQEWREPRDP